MTPTPSRSVRTLAAAFGAVALCCVKPVLPMILGAVGLGVLIPILVRDALLLPLLAVLGALTVLAWHRDRRRRP